MKGDAEVGFTTEHVYRVEPEQEGGVTWSIEPRLRQITGEGKYTAPAEGETPECKEQPIAKVGTEIAIIATRNREPKVSSSIKIKLRNWAIMGLSEVTLGGDPTTYDVKPVQDGGVTWDWSPKLGKLDGETGKYTPPKKEETPGAVPGVEITIKATRKQKPKESVTKRIKLVEST